MRALSSAQAPRWWSLGWRESRSAQVADEHQEPAERAEQEVPLKSLQIQEKSAFIRWLDYTNRDYTICAA